MDGQTPQFLQLIGEEAIAEYRRTQRVLRAVEKVLEESRKSGIRPTIPAAEAARQLGIDYKSIQKLGFTPLRDPNLPRVTLYYLDEITAWQKACETTEAQLHAARRARHTKA